MIGAYGADFIAGEAVAYGWLERRDGAWIQYNGAPEIHCRRGRLATVAASTVSPKCFGDSGDLKL